MNIPVYQGARKEPMSGMTSGKEPRYKYTSPSIKTQFGKPPELGYDINSYGLPVCDVQTERRNFPGYSETEVYTLEDLQKGDTSGTTETDSATAPSSGGYTRINNKSGPTSKWNSKRS